MNLHQIKADNDLLDYLRHRFYTHDWEQRADGTIWLRFHTRNSEWDKLDKFYVAQYTAEMNAQYRRYR